MLSNHPTIDSVPGTRPAPRGVAPRRAGERGLQVRLFLTGLLAGLVTVVVMLALRAVTETASLVEIAGEAALQVMPISLFEVLLRTLQETAKPLLFASVIGVFVLLGGGIARLDSGPARRLTISARARRIAFLAVGIWVPAAILTVLVASLGTTTLSNQSLLALGTVLLVDALTYALALYLLYPLVARTLERSSTRVDIDEPPENLGRRRLLARAASGAVALGSVAYLGRYVSSIKGGALGERGGIPEPITPNDDFYVISKNFVDPRLDADDWELEISGFVDRPLRLSHAALLAMPTVEQLTTLTCISNEVGGDLISNARWTGVRLADLLQQAGIQPYGSEVALYASDGYTESFPLSKALEPTTLLVYLMNGEPLSKKHGYPARLIVPGKYGIKNVKWLTKIELIAGDFKGYWQKRGWTDEATIKTMSRIDVPAPRAIVPFSPLEIGGVAFAGERGISSVEFSDDNGATWRSVDQLQPIALLSWVIWRSTWNPPGRGAFTLRVRATDGSGALQVADKEKPIPTGASGYHKVDVGVT
jgi:DMSO/TMAO reductase YedYZ molybdopterin-dependent catalytic subunit